MDLKELGKVTLLGGLCAGALWGAVSLTKRNEQNDKIQVIYNVLETKHNAISTNIVFGQDGLNDILARYEDIGLDTDRMKRWIEDRNQADLGAGTAGNSMEYSLRSLEDTTALIVPNPEDIRYLLYNED